MSKLTDWFPADVKPVRIGFYQRDWSDFDDGQGWADNDYWDGKNWRYSVRETIAPNNRRWRGLAADPGAKP